MKEISDAQKQASRENGKLSRGPVTEEGKKRASKNRLRHGLFSRVIVLDNERKKNFTDLTRSFNKTYRPQNEVERSIIECMAACVWKLKRAWAIESSLMNQKLEDPHASRLDWKSPSGAGPATPVADLSEQIEVAALSGIILESATDEQYAEEIGRTAAAWTSLASHPSFRSLLSRQGELHREFLRDLRHLQKERLGKK